jgi:exoribonuclease-2
MMQEQALAVFKNRPVVIKETSGDKIHIELDDGSIVKVREKDVELIHPGPVKDLHTLENGAAALLENAGAAVRDAWEVLEAEAAALTLKELAELCFDTFSPLTAWAAFRVLDDGLFFNGSAAALSPRKRADVEAEEKKRQEKQGEAGERERFLDLMRGRMKSQPLIHQGDDDTQPSPDSRFIQDVEALALGKSIKSKTMKDLGLSETPEDAHALLLKTGFWTVRVNPHPARFGLSLSSAKEPLNPPPDEQRRDLTALVSLAIDNPWSDDPDDAVSIEESGGRRILYVHVADPASSVAADSRCEREARDRGVTLYLPEGSFRMLSEAELPYFALGLREKSPALTFKVTLNTAGEIEDTEIFPSLVQVRRLTYGKADELLDLVSANADSPPDTSARNSDAALAAVMRSLDVMAERNMRRRACAGAINIELPEAHIFLADGQVAIEPIPLYRSADIVRECMLLAGEASARWVTARGFESSGVAGLAFPFVSQETGDMPVDVPDGYAGSYQLRRCMRPRTVSLRPAPHWGLGLDSYTQVTSPLRRYTDLLAHMQIRAVLRGTPPLSAEEVSARLAAAEAAAQAAVQAERASRAHWTMVYLSDKKDSVWDALALEKKINRWVFVIPALALETQVSLRKDVKPNEAVKLILKSVNIPRCEAVFAEN